MYIFYCTKASVFFTEFSIEGRDNRSVIRTRKCKGRHTNGPIQTGTQRTKMMLVILLAVIIETFLEVQGYACPGGYCYANGECKRHGDIWTSDCSTKRCRQLTSQQAIIETTGTECKDAYGQCKRHGDEMIVNMGGYGVKCRCTIGRDTWSYTQCESSGGTDNTGCNGCTVDGVCRGFGQHFKKDCFTYQCQRNGNSWIAQPILAGCMDINRKCWPSGSRIDFQKDGRRYDDCVCTISGTEARYSNCGGSSGSGGNYSPCTQGCVVQNNNGRTCYNVGDHWTSNCVTYQCERLGHFWTHAKPIRTECKDAYGACKRHNEKMSAVIGGYLFQNCRCSINGLHQTHHCTAK